MMSARDNAWYRLSSFANRLSGQIKEQKSNLREMAAWDFETAPEAELRKASRQFRAAADEIDELLSKVNHERARSAA